MMTLTKSANDWIIEVVVERLDIKNIIFEKVDQHRKAGSIVSNVHLEFQLTPC